MSARLALDWMRARSTQPPRWLFRGQTQVYPTILPSLYRLSPEQQNIWHTIIRRFVGARSGIAGHGIASPFDALAVLQHYLATSPSVDLTSTPEIALYFALAASASNERVIYAFPVASLEKAGFHIADHDFLALPLDAGGLMHRWLRQDGFTVTRKDWRSLPSDPKVLDLLKVSGFEEFRFTRWPDDDQLVAYLGDLEPLQNDPLAITVRSIVQSIALDAGFLDLVRDRLESSKTIDGNALLLEEINLLLVKAKERGRPPEELRKMERLLDSAIAGPWGTEWEAELTCWKTRVEQRSAG